MDTKTEHTTLPAYNKYMKENGITVWGNLAEDIDFHMERDKARPLIKGNMYLFLCLCGKQKVEEALINKDLIHYELEQWDSDIQCLCNEYLHFLLDFYLWCYKKGYFTLPDTNEGACPAKLFPLYDKYIEEENVDLCVPSHLERESIEKRVLAFFFQCGKRRVDQALTIPNIINQKFDLWIGDENIPRNRFLLGFYLWCYKKNYFSLPVVEDSAQLQAFISDKCNLNPTSSTNLDKLYSHYVNWQKTTPDYIRLDFYEFKSQLSKLIGGQIIITSKAKTITGITVK